MNVQALEMARRRVPSASVLINLISQRCRQLIYGQRPMLKPENAFEEKEDIAIREVAEGKIVAEIDLAKLNKVKH